jgi:hypothetical protein
LPVPDSPVISTVRSLLAAVAIWQSKVFITGELPIMPLSLKGNSVITLAFSMDDMEVFNCLENSILMSGLPPR